MNRRRHLKPAHPTQNLDSFLDILTNTVGVLMFISLFISLISIQASTTIRTPLVSKSEKKAHYFEVRGNRVTYLDDAAIDRQLTILVSSLPRCDRPDIPQNLDSDLYQYYLSDIEEYEVCTNRVFERLKGFQAQTKNYNVRLVGVDAIMYEPTGENSGETIKEIAKSDSEFRTVLRKLNPQTDYLAFIVRPDSFSAFRAARQQAWEKGFEIGWEPQSVEKPIVFNISGSGGRAVGVQ
ncbi:hypothetical protein NIES593_10160 [Hydrococcus rivularis NIES-593]|uniref:Uncharacterized protein n=1 Tax=Hydrococcus rivularis NIES-593 TaxID=1921803 RepID=A0A1U7HHY1_9CYAN|nr:hypothetical protein [Hydrococcus rivularis]OKH23202.1 hypothetical protein NIES593_10160 [Hydrococcus rivularis NIES-593]